ncbi:response regulator transcription factor [Ellagibacter isourolithinifaciens]|uniref:response regulator transcription factor n=1 Tax=Ellagibacter isourolithinifaciens TaxID=2137581 RepID=UPI003AEF1F1D
MAFSLKALPLQLRRSVGLGCYLAWVYCSLFSCGLVPVVIRLCSIERSWVYSGIGEAIAAIAVIVVYALLRGRGRGEAAQHMIGALGAGCACIGSVLVWVSHLDISWYAALTVAGGLCCGAGLSLLGILWGSRFSYCDEEHIESSVPLSFVISFVVYFVLLAVKGPLFMVVDAVLPVVSAWIVFRPRCGRNVSADGEAVGALAHVGLRKQFSHLVSLFVLYFLIWFQIALFRVASSPMTYGGRFMHYLVPFSIAAVLAIAAFLTCMRQTRFLNFTFLYRWSVPLMIIGCGLLLIDLGIPEQHSAAYAVNFIAMFGVQMCAWVVAPKYAGRIGVSPFVLFGGLFAAEGLGIFLALTLSLPLFDVGAPALANLTLIATGAVALVAMLVGFNPRWLFLSDAVRRFTDAEFAMSIPRLACSACVSPCSDAGAAGNGVARSAAGGCASGAGANASGGVTAGANDAGSGVEYGVAASGGMPFGFASSSAPGSVARSGSAVPLSAGEELASIFEKTAEELQLRYGLTERETQIAALLLSGRSRPFIRDELVISLNTVHAHARNIYSKCGVHSQQEFMDFVHLDSREGE